MADLSEINLDEAGEDTSGLASHQQEYEVSPTSSSSQGSEHSSSKDLHLYFKQSWKARLGITGVIITLFFALMLALSFALLIASYTPVGKSFLQTLKFCIF